MKLQFKHQPFQAEAAAAVCDVFRGQSLCAQAADRPLSLAGTGTGLCNQPLAPELTDARILKNLHAVQRRVGLPLSKALAGPGINLSVEMETGTGKTYTYVKTIYELNARYGWSRFIIVVPSVAVREGVYRSLQTTQEHFAGEYGRRLRFFIYNSDRLAQVDRFASDSAIQVMIINMQASGAAAPSTSSRPPGLFSSLTSPRAWRAARLGRACASSTPCSPCATPPPTGRRTTWCTVWTPWTPITGIW